MGTWTEITQVTEEKNLQSWFCRLFLQVGPGDPLASMSWDLALLDMGLRIKIEKMLLVLYIRNLEQNTLAKRIYEEQKKNGLV